MARTFKNLYPEICDWDNLYQAWRQARRGGKRRWPTVAAFEFDLEENLWVLHEELRDQSYRPGPYRHFTITEPKVRRISAAPVRDRVVHHALMRVTWPIFEALPGRKDSEHSWTVDLEVRKREAAREAAPVSVDPNLGI